MNELLVNLAASRPSTTADPWQLREQLHNKRDNRDRLASQMLDPSRERKPRRVLGFTKYRT